LFNFSGIPLFIIGALINLHSDHVLRTLRRTGESGYKIPYGGAFQYVSGANFFGEILEWIGYALFAQTRTAWAFAIVTAANTIPRARQHHRFNFFKFNLI
jgi:3-oxo-5-alpha-steroid 4-dehydrogenase 1